MGLRVFVLILYVNIFPLILNYSVRSLYSHTNSYNNAVTSAMSDDVDGSQRRLGYLWFSEFVGYRDPLRYNYLITDCEVVTGKSQTEALPY